MSGHLTTLDIFEVAAAGQSRSTVGESPMWDAATGTLWFVDIRGRCVRSLRPADGTEQTIPTPELAGGVAVGANGEPYGAFETGLFSLNAEGGWTHVSAPPDLPPHHRFNDLCVDPAGRLIAGTMRDSAHGAAPSGALYLFDGAAWRTLFTGFWTINGLAFSPDGRTLYLSDSHPEVRRVWRCAYDPAEGRAGPREVFIDMRGFAGRPDGAAVDSVGGYWLAGVGGSCLYRFSPAGALLQPVPVPVERPTKPAFGGPNLDLLFVTSLDVGVENPSPQGLDGALLRLAPGVQGAPVPRLRF